MSQPQHAMVDDMYQLMGERVSRAVRDTADTCIRANIKPREILEIAASILLAELVRCAVTTRCDKEEFLQLCGLGWDHLADQYLKDYEDD